MPRPRCRLGPRLSGIVSVSPSDPCAEGSKLVDPEAGPDVEMEGGYFFDPPSGWIDEDEKTLQVGHVSGVVLDIGAQLGDIWGSAGGPVPVDGPALSTIGALLPPIPVKQILCCSPIEPLLLKECLLPPPLDQSAQPPPLARFGLLAAHHVGSTHSRQHWRPESRSTSPGATRIRTVYVRWQRRRSLGNVGCSSGFLLAWGRDK